MLRLPPFEYLPARTVDDAVKYTLRSDVPVGLFLSGGTDSALVAESAARQGHVESAFCVDFAEPGFSEWPLASQAAKRLGVDIVRVPLEAGVLSRVTELAGHLDDPLADSSALVKLYADERDHAAVRALDVIVGDLNGDGKPDFVALISQEHETIVAFINEGSGKFRPEPLFSAAHPAWGASGIELVDLNGDNKLDVLVTRGTHVESRHRVHAAIVDAQQGLIAEARRPEEVVPWRSCAKPAFDPCGRCQLLGASGEPERGRSSAHPSPGSTASPSPTPLPFRRERRCLPVPIAGLRYSRYSSEARPDVGEMKGQVVKDRTSPSRRPAAWLLFWYTAKRPSMKPDGHRASPEHLNRPAHDDPRQAGGYCEVCRGDSSCPRKPLLYMSRTSTPNQPGRLHSYFHLRASGARTTICG